MQTGNEFLYEWSAHMDFYLCMISLVQTGGKVL